MEHRKEDIALIKKYVSGGMSAREMYALERRAQQDPLLMDLMEGMEQESLAIHQMHLEEIASQLEKRVQARKAPRAWRPMWMAAASLVFALCVLGFWFLKEPKMEEDLVHQVKPILKDTAVQVNPLDTAPMVAAVPTSKSKVAVQRKQAGAESKNDAAKGLKLAARPAAALEPAAEEGSLVAEEVASAAADTAIPPGGHATRVAGSVIDEATKTPLAGVVVGSPGLSRTTNTDEQGRFSLEVEQDNKQVELSYSGYAQRKVPISGKDSLHIALRPAFSSLSEVVITAQGKQVQRNPMLAAKTANSEAAKSMRIRGVNNVHGEAEPLIGWEAYEAYLNKEAAVFDGHSGTIALAFSLDAEGKPTDIRIKKGGDEILEKRAIDMIMRGSVWKRAAVEVEIEISITFEQP